MGLHVVVLDHWLVFRFPSILECAKLRYLVVDPAGAWFVDGA